VKESERLAIDFLEVDHFIVLIIFGDYIVLRYQDEEDNEQIMENIIMKLQVMMDDARKREQDGNNNNSIVGIIDVIYISYCGISQSEGGCEWIE
jgi:hypothetical protein